MKMLRAACKSHGGDLPRMIKFYSPIKMVVNGVIMVGLKIKFYFILQKDTWEELQKDPENMDTCGNWGVNGGYFDNPNTLFEPTVMELNLNLRIENKKRY